MLRAMLLYYLPHAGSKTELPPVASSPGTMICVPVRSQVDLVSTVQEVDPHDQ